MQNSIKYISYEEYPPKKHSKKWWKQYYKKNITEWNSFQDWWNEMLYKCKLIIEVNNNEIES